MRRCQVWKWVEEDVDGKGCEWKVVSTHVESEGMSGLYAHWPH
jgi:hypothetical protein